MNKQALVVFSRYPRPGSVKTRLISSMGEAGAAELHRQMAEYTLRQAMASFPAASIRLEVRFSGGSVGEMQEWLGEDPAYVSQTGGDLGERMARAFSENFDSGRKRVVIIGTDCPQLTVFHLKHAFEMLKSHDMVIGPSQDGGYYLLGLGRMIPELFQHINWGTEEVFFQTMERASKQGLSVETMGVLSDIDTPHDLPVWDRVKNRFISIIIPALNEEENILSTLEHVGKYPHTEVIVVDGRSSDNTAGVAEEWGAKVLSSKPNRGMQMNSGAEKAAGDILLFMHADTLPPRDYVQLIRAAMDDPEVLGGYFRLKFQPSTPYLRFKEKKVSFRTKNFKMPFGDQAYFIRAPLFREMGGFREIPLMEDVEFIRRLRRMGKLIYLQDPVITSSRHFQRRGTLLASIVNKIVYYGYFLGVSPDLMARWYYKNSKQARSRSQKL